MFQSNSPSSVTLQPGEGSQSKPLGIEYAIKCLVADNEEDIGHKRSSVGLIIKKVSAIPSPCFF